MLLYSVTTDNDNATRIVVFLKMRLVPAARQKTVVVALTPPQAYVFANVASFLAYHTTSFKTQNPFETFNLCK
jgi:hypothetical protein